MNDQLEFTEAERIVVIDLLEQVQTELLERILHTQSFMVRTSLDRRLRIVQRLLERYQTMLPV
jgi:hypothetical protein